VSNVSTKIQPVLVVDGGGVPVPPPGGLKAPSVATTTQDLSAAPLDFTDAIATIKSPGFIALHLDPALPGPQTFSVTYVSADGAGFNTLIIEEVLPTGTTDKFFAMPPGLVFRAADHLQVELTDVGSPTVDANLTINYDP